MRLAARVLRTEVIIAMLSTMQCPRIIRTEAVMAEPVADRRALEAEPLAKLPSRPGNGNNTGDQRRKFAFDFKLLWC